MKYINLVFTMLLALSLPNSAIANASIRGDYVSYSFPITPTTHISEVDQPAQVSSKSYWKTVTGKQLKSGVDLQNSGAQPLVLLSHHSGSQPSQSIDVKQLSLNGEQGSPVPIKVVSEDALGETGFFARSAAIMSKNAKSNERLTLQTTQSFDDDQLFVMTVKDKNSPLSLNVVAPHQNLKANQSHIARVSLNDFSGKKLKLSQNKPDIEVILHAPDGKRVPLKIKQGQQDFTILTPQLDNKAPPRDGLYDVEVLLKTTVNGKTFQRNAKVAVAMAQNTAQLEDFELLEETVPTANVTVNAFQPGRYEVRAVLYGTSSKGDKIAIMEGHAAQSVNAGQEQIPIPFDLNKLSDQTIAGPYQIGNVRLYDQGQLALLDESN